LLVFKKADQLKQIAFRVGSPSSTRFKTILILAGDTPIWTKLRDGVGCVFCCLMSGAHGATA
jgi:hypothetical protein